MQVGRIIETCLYSPDLDRAEEFYRRVLCLEVLARNSSRHVFFRCGGGMFLLFNPKQSLKGMGEIPKHGARGAGHVAFSVCEKDVPSWRQHLHRHQVEIEQEVSWPRGGTSIYFRDPAGNSVELTTPATWSLVESPNTGDDNEDDR